MRCRRRRRDTARGSWDSRSPAGPNGKISLKAWADLRMKPITWTADELWTGIFSWDRTEKGSLVESYT